MTTMTALVTVDNLTRNILSMFADASQDVVSGGSSWYTIARRWASMMSREYGTSVEVVAAVVSALSPRNRWERNLFDAQQVLMHYAEGMSPTGLSCGTFKKNVAKAWSVIETGNIDLVRTSRKTDAFLDNIANPQSSKVTVDVWAMRAAHHDVKMVARGLTDKVYDAYEQAYIAAAAEHSMQPCQMQAITWMEIRHRANNRQTMEQLRLL